MGRAARACPGARSDDARASSAVGEAGQEERHVPARAAGVGRGQGLDRPAHDRRSQSELEASTELGITDRDPVRLYGATSRGAALGAGVVRTRPGAPSLGIAVESLAAPHLLCPGVALVLLARRQFHLAPRGRVELDAIHLASVAVGAGVAGIPGVSPLRPEPNGPARRPPDAIRVVRTAIVTFIALHGAADASRREV